MADTTNPLDAFLLEYDPGTRQLRLGGQSIGRGMTCAPDAPGDHAAIEAEADAVLVLVVARANAHRHRSATWATMDTAPRDARHVLLAPSRSPFARDLPEGAVAYISPETTGIIGAFDPEEKAWFVSTDAADLNTSSGPLFDHDFGGWRPLPPPEPADGRSETLPTLDRRIREIIDDIDRRRGRRL